ncbi:hypothetical protein M5K25_012304 [Dendrobium thyrsiflorum]|uniref:Uncharacterized protein n=1 Tax=Dendrobium thyrsiflorum TaxID=117978 RepID=A0ABD0V3T8_DENTH
MWRLALPPSSTGGQGDRCRRERLPSAAPARPSLATSDWRVRDERLPSGFSGSGFALPPSSTGQLAKEIVAACRRLASPGSLATKKSSTLPAIPDFLVPIFQCVEWSGLRSLLHYLRRDMQLISRNTTRSDYKKMFTKEKCRLQKEILK